MKSQPAYFEAIRKRASQRWEQLESDPDLAGPWHQLFKQVQSPRHILSELLQNADDAGATEAEVRIEDMAFIFSHNGEDFKDEHFESLCRFGYSNKRALHTIGFRGIGFKSTFSLGDIVELQSPTLSVVFNRKRFTEPQWLDSVNGDSGGTHIRVAISDVHRLHEVEKNLQDWTKSSISLLFFKSIRRLKIGDQEVHWQSLGCGPVSETEWMALDKKAEEPFLLVRSDAVPFPEEALTEIKQERLLGIDQEADFPPCKVEIVLGAKGRLYVVLPTGVETRLPFACNAPFIQDPARVKIKDPETSPTNRWLLERIGSLAASVMLQWLEKTSMGIADRSKAYGLFPNEDQDDDSLECVCASAVETAFDEAIEDKSFLLTNAGELKPEAQCVVIPEVLFDVWPVEQMSTLMDSYAKRSVFSRQVSAHDRNKLVHRKILGSICKEDVLAVLKSKNLPRPESWRGLLILWTYLAPELTGYGLHSLTKEEFRILPVQGKDILHSANEVVRLGEKKLLQSDADWEFLAAHLLVLNQNWPRYLAEQRRSAEESGDAESKKSVEAALAVMEEIGLEETSDVSEVIEQIAVDFFRQISIPLVECIQVAHIAAKLSVTTRQSFRFATLDNHLRAAQSAVLFDADGTLAALLPETWCSAHLLHGEYTKAFNSCTSEEWFRWIKSGRAGIHTFAPLVQTSSRVWARQEIETFLRQRGFRGVASYPYVKSSFLIHDWDFEGVHWKRWNALAKEDANLWGKLLERILDQQDAYWSKGQSAQAFQVATTSNKRAITDEPLLPSWIVKLRNLPCLPDTRGFYQKPADLLRRTPETESLMDVEPFIHGRLDTESNRPLLLLLGVRDTPTGPDRLLGCLRALTKAERPPVHEVEKWYRRLDQMVANCAADDFAVIRKVLREEKILLTETGGWAKSSGVFLSLNEEDVPGAEIIRASIRDLALWGKIGIEQRPTADLAIQWLKELPSNKALPADDVRRVRAMLMRHATRIWNECGHWLNLSGEWVPTGSLSFSLTMQSLIAWSHLFESVKRRTADFQRLPAEIVEASPFCDLPSLASQIEDRFLGSFGSSINSERKPWLNRMGTELRRISRTDEAESTRIRSLAADLAETAWLVSPTLEIVPYVNGLPAGTARRAAVVWLDRVLYVEQLSHAKLARLVPDRLGKYFDQPDITAALNYCFGRSAQEVTEYIEENFTLLPREVITSAVDIGNDAKENHSATEPVSNTPLETIAEPTAANDEVDFISEPSSDDAEESTVDPVETPEEQEQVEATPTKTRVAPEPAKPSIIERFAVKQGFKQNGDGSFYHADGSRIAKANEDRFPWEKRSADGTVLRRYWPRDHCLEREPLQVEADVWGLIDKFPETYSLVLSNPQDDPIEVPGERLRAMRDDGKLILYPATYRLVYDHD